MALTITWVHPGTGEPAGAEASVTPAEDGTYRLPDLLLTPGGSVAPFPYNLRVVSAAASSEPAAQAVRAAWERQSELSFTGIASPTTVGGRRIPVAGVTAPATVELAVVVDYTDAGFDGRPQRIPRSTEPARVTLTLTTAERPPASPAERLTPGTASTASTADPDSADGTDEGRVARPAPRPDVRTLATSYREGRGHNGWAAVDFGTTACTVTVYDRFGHLVASLYPSERRTLRAELLELLKADPEQPALRAEWHGQLDNARSDLVVAIPDRRGRRKPPGDVPRLTVLPDPRDDLVRLIEQEPDADRDTTHRLLLILDRLRPRCTQGLRAWLADRLHRVYDQTFSLQALDYNGAFLVDLVPGRNEVSSRISVTRAQPLGARLGDDVYGDGTATAPGEALGTVFNLKQHFGARQTELTADGLDIGTYELFAASVDWLLRASEAFIDSSPQTLDRGYPFDHVLVTYPTAAPPEVRERLRAALGPEGLNITRVDTRYDEAIAAALFYITRDLGTDLALGLEAMRARMRMVGGDPRHRTENLLVMDIGGGTVDAAVVTLKLSETTPDLPGVNPEVAGKFYRLVPTLRGTAGEPNRGGDALTLRIFHWIKAEIVDWLLTQGRKAKPEAVPSPDAESDAESWHDWVPQFLQAQGGDYRPGEFVEQTLDLLLGSHGLSVGRLLGSPVHPRVDEVLTTSWRHGGREPTENTRGRLAFRRLWDLAEDVKLRLGAGDPVSLTGDRVDPVLRAAVDFGGHEFPRFTADVPLDPDTFHDLVDPLVRRGTTLAVRLAQASLNEGEQLDRVVLSGRGSRLPLVAETLADELARHQAASAGQPVVSGARVVREEEYAKHAASAGACIAEAYRQDQITEDAARGDLALGRTRLWLDVNNLFRNLPCSFERKEHGMPGGLVAQVGEPFQHDPDGRAYIRCDFGRPLAETLYIQRQVPGGPSQPWGQFRRKHVAIREGLEVAGEGQDQPWEQELRTELEIDGDLRLALFVWRGERPHYRVPAGGVDLRRQADAQGIRVDAEDIRHGLRVLATTSGGDPAMPVFPPETEGEPKFPEAFVLEGLEEGPTVTGIVSQPLPPLRQSRKWSFSVTDPVSGTEKTIHVAEAPEGTGPFFGSLDETGTLRIHLGKPGYRMADTGTLREVRDTPGAVLQCRFEQHDEKDNPDDHYNGRQ